MTGATGVQGAAGRRCGATGATGVNAFTQTTASFTAPASSGNVTIAVTANTGGWMATGQTVFISGGAGYYQVVTPGVTSVTVKNLGYPGNATSGTIATPDGEPRRPAGPDRPAGRNRRNRPAGRDRPDRPGGHHRRRPA